MANMLSMTLPKIVQVEEEVDLDALCESSKVGPESIIDVVVSTPRFTWWTREVDVAITVRDAPETPWVFVAHEEPDATGCCAFYGNYKNPNPDLDRVIEVGTDGNPDLTVCDLLPVVEELAYFVFWRL